MYHALISGYYTYFKPEKLINSMLLLNNIKSNLRYLQIT